MLAMYRNTKVTKLSIKVPFVFSEKLDNRNVMTVGDQFLSEHVFAYHQNLSWKTGSYSLFSNIIADYNSNNVSIKEIRKARTHTGKEIGLEVLCEFIKKSFDGTLHAQYKELVRDISCNHDEINIKFTTIPNNWRSLFSSPDFAITDGELYTGPYYLQSKTSSMAHLRINEYYPKELRANQVSDVVIESYPANNTELIVKSLDPDKDHATFMYGHVLKKRDLDYLKSKKFNLQIFQSEWLVYLGFNERVTKNDRAKIATFLNGKKDYLHKFSELGVLAYSMAPSDRPWGLDKAASDLLQEVPADLSIKREYNIATLDEWAALPLFSEALNLLKEKFRFQIKLYSRKDMSKLYGEDNDIYLSPMGVSPDDPVGHLFFFSSFSSENLKIINSSNELQRIASLRDGEEFNLALREVEKKIIRNYLLVPLFHFPSVVAESFHLGKDPDLSWDWGIQSWTYQIH